MRISKFVLKLISFLTALVMAALACASVASAADDIPAHDPSRECRFVVACIDDDLKVEGFQISIYQIAVLGEDGTYTIAPDYVDSGITVEQITTTEITESTCTMLQSYTKARGLTPLQTQTTDSEGEALFEMPQQGYFLFLQTGSSGLADLYFEIIPGVVIVPYLGSNDNWRYDAYAIPKLEHFVPPTPTPPPTPVQTGDDSSIDFYRMLMSYSIGGAVGITIIYIATNLITNRKKEDYTDK